jgi:tRNA U34 2-thiouridine synthase MnmA/TrmU
MKGNKYIIYEAEKAKLDQLNLPYEEYEKALRELAMRLKI